MARETFKNIRRELRRRVPLERGIGFTTVSDGFEDAVVEVVVDMAEIARSYGVQAMNNKSGRTKHLHGAVIVNVLSRIKVKG